MIDIVIISDIKIYLEGLRQLLTAKGSINVMGTANTCESAIALLSRERPRVILLDMSINDSCDLASKIASLETPLNIVALGVTQNEPNIISYAKAGITGYVPREAAVEELVAAITEAANGDCYCPPEITEVLLKEMRAKGGAGLSSSGTSSSGTSNSGTSISDHSSSDAFNSGGPNSGNASSGNTSSSNTHPGNTPEAHFPTEGLTRRERQVVTLLGEGLSNKQIANHLCIEISTVKNHVHNLLVKLKAKNRAQAVYLLQSTRTPYFESVEPGAAAAYSAAPSLSQTGGATS